MTEDDLIVVGRTRRRVNTFSFALFSSPHGQRADLGNHTDLVASQYGCERPERLIGPNGAVEDLELKGAASNTETDIVNGDPFLEVHNHDSALGKIGKVRNIVYSDWVAPLCGSTAVFDRDLQAVVRVGQGHAENASRGVMDEHTSRSGDIGQFVAADTHTAERARHAGRGSKAAVGENLIHRSSTRVNDEGS